MFDQFARDQYIRVMETNEEASMGAYAISESIELDQILVWINVEGTPGGSETLQVHVYGSAEAETPLASSDVVTLASVVFNEGEPDEYTGAADSIGYIPFTYNREILGVDTYHLRLEATNYTRNADTFYIGYVFDNPEKVYARSIPDETGAKALIVGYS